jgi:hypothetical protein
MGAGLLGLTNPALLPWIETGSTQSVEDFCATTLDALERADLSHVQREPSTQLRSD